MSWTNMINPRRLERIWQAGQQGLVGADATAVLLEDRQFEIVGEAVADGNCTYDDDHGLLLTSSAGDDDQCFIFPSAAADNRSIFREYNWGPENETEFECVVQTGTLANAVVFLAGLALTHPATYDSAVDADQVMFSYLQGTDTNWTIDANVANTDVTAYDTGVTVVASNTYHFAIRFDAARRAHCFINEIEVFVSKPMTAGAAWMPLVGLENGSAASKTLHVRSIAMARNWGVN